MTMKYHSFSQHSSLTADKGSNASTELSELHRLLRKETEYPTHMQNLESIPFTNVPLRSWWT
jgi:hypothetical protein